MSNQDYPECEKLSLHSSEMATIRSFMEWASGQGLEFGQWNGNRFETANINTESLLHQHFEIDEKKIESERRAMLASMQK